VRKKIAIIGGGLSGISAAIYGINQGFDIHLYEKSSHLGGRISHSRVDGFVIDRGFQVINPGYSEIKKLKAMDEVNSSPIFSRLDYLDNEGARRFISPDSIPSLFSHSSGSLFQKFDFLMYLIFRTSPLVTFGDQRVRFKRLYDVVLAPFLSGVFLDDPAQIRSTIAQKICRSFIAAKPQLIDGGVGNFITGLSSRIPQECIHLDTEISEIWKNPSGKFTVIMKASRKNKVLAEDFDFVIDATCSSPGGIAGTRAGNTRKWLDSTTLYLGCSEIKSTNNALFLGKKGIHSFVNSIAVSQANPSYAPAGEILIATTYLGEIKKGDLQKNEGELLRQIAEVYGVEAVDLKVVSLQYVPQSLPAFERADSTDPMWGELPQVDPLDSGIIYAGDYLVAPSQNGALASGRMAIESIVKSSRR
jgi:hypothetical protein